LMSLGASESLLVCWILALASLRKELIVGSSALGCFFFFGQQVFVNPGVGRRRDRFE
jgi:hypothetical protein